MNNMFNDYMDGKVKLLRSDSNGSSLSKINWFIRTNDDGIVNEVKADVYFSDIEECNRFESSSHVFGICDIFRDEEDCHTILFWDFPKVDESVLDDSCLSYDEKYWVWMFTNNF